MERLEVTTDRTTHSFTYVGVTHVVLLVGVVLYAVVARQPTALVLAAPTFVVLASAALDVRVSQPVVRISCDRRRAIEGDTVTVTVGIRARGAVPSVEVEFEPAGNLDHEGSLRVWTSIEAGVESLHDFRIVVEDWGVLPLGSVHLRVRDRFGLSALHLRVRVVSPLRVHIHEELVRSLTEPNRFRRVVGSHLSDERGEGCEIADIRPYQAGDRLQALNWRISARNDEPWITLRHPDRSTTVVLLLDAFQQFGHQRGDALRRSVRATLGIGRLHLDAQDPVGLMIVGNGVRWFSPELGRMHMHKMTDALLDLSTNGWAEKRQSQELVHRLIPQNAVVLAVSPLNDARFVRVLTSLRSRGQSVQVIEPVTHWPKFATEHFGKPIRPEYSWRIYSLQRQAHRNRLSNAGVPVIPWEESQPIESVLLGLRLSQRARRAGAL